MKGDPQLFWLSGGEKKRNETLQLGVLAPKIAKLDELGSGLNVDAPAPVPVGLRRPPTRATSVFWRSRTTTVC